MGPVSFAADLPKLFSLLSSTYLHGLAHRLLLRFWGHKKYHIVKRYSIVATCLRHFSDVRATQKQTVHAFRTPRRVSERVRDLPTGAMMIKCTVQARRWNQQTDDLTHLTALTDTTVPDLRITQN